MSPCPGVVWLADLGLAAKTRPVVVVSRRDADPPRALVIYVPLTTQATGSPYEVGIPVRWDQGFRPATNDSKLRSMG
jgi:mRNA interferase MazF